MTQVLRILDANANRAREAMRVMEEAARFVLGDRSLSESLKNLRHDFAAAMANLPGLSDHRDTPNDVGTTISTQAETHRADVASVVTAAGKRLSEALRVIEEYGKTLNQPDLPRRIEALRYRGYTLEKQLQTAFASGQAKQWRLCVLLTAAICPDGDWLGVAKAAIAGGADCLQLREKQLDGGELLRRARQLIELARPKGVSVIINDRPDIAMLAGADGVHVGQTDLPVGEVRKLVGRSMLIGVSTSNLDQAAAAVRDGADYCGVGPMYPTTTKHKDHIVGPAYLRDYVRGMSLPHLAIGGITLERVSELVAAGVKGIAVSSAICGSADPQATTRAFCDAMDARRL